MVLPVTFEHSFVCCRTALALSVVIKLSPCFTAFAIEPHHYLRPSAGQSDTENFEIVQKIPRQLIFLPPCRICTPARVLRMDAKNPRTGSVSYVMPPRCSLFPSSRRYRGRRSGGQCANAFTIHCSGSRCCGGLVEAASWWHERRLYVTQPYNIVSRTSTFGIRIF